MKPSTLVRLYPRWWRRRYGPEMLAVLETGPIGRRGSLDLVRGALDAWLHPTAPSRLPATAALVGGGLWTMIAAVVLSQPVPADWPGYLAEVVPLALLAAPVLLVATLGCALRAGDGGGPTMAAASAATGVGYLAWMATLGAAGAGLADGPTLAAAQTLAMLGAAGVGVVLVRGGDDAIGILVITASVAMLLPWAVTWLWFGAAWTAVGIILAWERPRRVHRSWERR